jgi:hypothetical protein
VVVDRHVQVLPAGAAGAGDAVSEDALADAEEAAQLLGVHVRELAGARARSENGDRAVGGQVVSNRSAQHLADGGGRSSDDAGDDRRSGSATRTE